MTECDVLVVGAGPAGCATAIRTARAGLSTVLLDRASPSRHWAGESLPPGMTKLVRSVFGDEILSEDLHRTAFGTRSVWGSAELVETDFLLNPLGEGWLLDRARFDHDAKRTAAVAGVAILEVRHLGSLTRDASAWHVDVGGGSFLSAGFVVDATGRSAALLRKLGVGRIVADRQIAILAIYPDDGDDYSGTTVEAVRDGWWYTTPLPGRTSRPRLPDRLRPLAARSTRLVRNARRNSPHPPNSGAECDDRKDARVPRRHGPGGTPLRRGLARRRGRRGVLRPPLLAGPRQRRPHGFESRSRNRAFRP